MTAKTKIFLIIAGIVGYVGYKKYSLSQKVNVTFRDLSINWGNIWKPIANIVLAVQNPTGASADIQNVSGKIYLQNLQIGLVQNIKIVQTIKPNQITNVDFNIDLDTIGIGLGLLTTNLKNETIKFVGDIKIDFFTIPLNFEYKFL